MIGMRGRKVPMAMLDGELVEVRQMVKTGNSLTVSIPKLWIEVAKLNGDFDSVAIIQKENVLIIKPYYKKVIDIVEGEK